jgi:hypothetical protein
MSYGYGNYMSLSGPTKASTCHREKVTTSLQCWQVRPIELLEAFQRGGHGLRIRSCLITGENNRGKGQGRCQRHHYKRERGPQSDFRSLPKTYQLTKAFSCSTVAVAFSTEAGPGILSSSNVPSITEAPAPIVVLCPDRDVGNQRQVVKAIMDECTSRHHDAVSRVRGSCPLARSIDP